MTISFTTLEIIVKLVYFCFYCSFKFSKDSFIYSTSRIKYVALLNWHLWRKEEKEH